MTEEQRRQAAAQRCADLANAISYSRGNAGLWKPIEFSEDATAVGHVVALNAILELDELACQAAEDAQKFGLEDLGRMARRHILAQPKPSPVERLARLYGTTGEKLANVISGLGLQLVEKSDD